MDRSPRTWLIGQHNPYGDDPRHALYPNPPTSAGGRLCAILELRPTEYVRRFERRNLLTQAKWSAPLARAAAQDIATDTAFGDRLVLLGERVAAAFGVGFRENLCAPKFLLLPSRGPLLGRATLVIPHPSGLSRLWNEPGMAERVRAALVALEAT